VKENIIKNKSYEFALRIIKLYEHLKVRNVDYVLTRQVLEVELQLGKC